MKEKQICKTKGILLLGPLLVTFVPFVSFTQEWVYRYSGQEGSFEACQSIVYGTDGYLYTAGYITGLSGGYDFGVISLTTSGGERWVYRYDGGLGPQALSIKYGTDGNLYSTGYITSSSGWRSVVISNSTNGGERWVYVYDPGYATKSEDVVYGADNNIYITGVTSTNTSDLMVYSLTNSGAWRWIYRTTSRTGLGIFYSIRC